MAEPLMRNPYAASVTRDSDIRTTEWPSTTGSLCADVEHLKALPPEQVNQPILALIWARKTLMDAALACRHAAKQWSERPLVHDRLLSLAHEVLDAQTRFPLQIDSPACRAPSLNVLADANVVRGVETQDKGYRVVEE